MSEQSELSEERRLLTFAKSNITAAYQEVLSSGKAERTARAQVFATMAQAQIMLAMALKETREGEPKPPPDTVPVPFQEEPDWTGDELA